MAEKTLNIKPQREESLDSLRGLAIFGMVFSGSELANLLPRWMSHAQVPYAMGWDGTIPGITWVDLVFPFFLFSMGMAIPLALGKKLKNGETLGEISLNIVKRYLLILYFSFMFQSFHPWTLPHDLGWWSYAIPFGAFVLMTLTFTTFPFVKSNKTASVLHYSGLLLSAVYLWINVHYGTVSIFNEEGRFVLKSNIIFNVLANAYLFGAFIWMFTRKKHWARIWILPMVFAIIATQKAEDGGMTWQYFIKTFPWGLPTGGNETVSSFYSMIAAVYNFTWLKYLFIIIPGTIIGDIFIKKNEDFDVDEKMKKTLYIMLALSVALVPINLCCLLGRYMLLGFVLTVVILFVLYKMSKTLPEQAKYIKSLVRWGAAILILGLFLEQYEGGIKKDMSTYSYYFTTTGLGIYTLCSFYIMNRLHFFKWFGTFFALLGKNPMLAYCVGALLIQPIFYFTGFDSVIDWIATTGNASKEAGDVFLAGCMGLLRGVIFTGGMAVITILAVKKRWFWKS
ncbi:MAG: DUF5009 domain-containing protein [Flavobacteriales bacterium]|nr:DUF5009 domain-containing protein [Flavobacteriales bacterium]